ncbi:MAG: fibronectin type III domain-containing protein [Limisphaerales bacterium]|jgi:hypothetical protein
MKLLLTTLSAFLITQITTQAHQGSHLSVHDTVAGITRRLRQTYEPEELKHLTRQQVESNLTRDDLHALATAHITFEINTPAIVFVLHDTSLGNDPFWLESENFENTGSTWEIIDEKFQLWRKTFPAGTVGLGVNSISGGGEHYLIALKPTDPAANLHVSNLYPGQLRLTTLKPDTAPYADLDVTFPSVPESLQNLPFIQTLRNSRADGKLLGLFRTTQHASTPQPDHVVLTWNNNPQTSQTIQWRTSSNTTKGLVAYQERALYHHPKPHGLKKIKAHTTTLTDPYLVNDPAIHRHTATLTGLKPNTTYVYSVGDGSRNGWSELAEFTTAPDQIRPFSFVYMGDAQNGLDRWGTLAHNAFRERPDAAFYLMAGDLINRGNERDDWDSFFANATGIFNRRPLVPVIGNHECQGGHPTLYLEQFSLPLNGPANIEAERCYAFEYSNALFVILDSNLEPETMTPWLENTLAHSKATWKFVAYHHPAYSSSPGRDNAKLRREWTPLFDKYHVDLALQGHDHAYLRTHPLRNNQRVENPANGTTYVVSVSGTKMYDQASRETTAFGMTKVATYQTLDIQISGDRLVYRAYDIDGNLRDELIIAK